ncbi:MAG: DUF2800 domain-containing protein [Clostridiales bacterium]|nr:DUF2800 domain-containing protein [Clostridiales bacterium]
MPPEKHAYLSASGSSRWLHCTPSARLEAQFPSVSSPYAEAGTLAHSMAELKARRYFLEPMSTRTYNASTKKLKQSEHYDPAMDGATDEYLDYLKQLAMAFSEPPFVALETRVDFSHWVPGGFGTADCIMIGNGRLCVCDYKNGAGVPVDATVNSQMMLYALGALSVYAPIFGDSIQDIHLAIIQPHAGGVKEWRCPRTELEEWGETVVKPAAQLAIKGEGAFRPSTDPNGGCRFCKAKAQCRARAEAMLSLESEQVEPALLTNDELGDLLRRSAGLAAWAEDLKTHALAELLNGRPVPGYKAVEGRSTRTWTDMEEAFSVLQTRNVPEAMLWERKPVTVAGLEKALGKKVFAQAAAGLVAKKPGRPTLVPESDPRTAYDPARAAFQPEVG